MPDAFFTNLTGATEIGANCYEVQLGGKRILLDAGMHPQLEGEAALPLLRLVPDGSVDGMVLSHSHQDHLGALPVAMRRQKQAPVFMSEATAQLAEIMLHNSVNVMMRRAEEGTGAQPQFFHREVDNATKRWRTAPLHVRFNLNGERLSPGETDEVSLEFFDAGHILGSTATLIEGDGRRILYTGDVNFDNQTLMQAASLPEEPVDTIIVETTRGDHATPESFTRAGEEQRFAEALKATLDRGGCVFIPLFALGKTQEVIAMLQRFVETGFLREMPIYIGGLSTKLTEVYDRLTNRTRRSEQGRKLLDAHNLFTVSGPEAFATKLKGGRIYALSSGMMSENTLSHGLVGQILSHPEHSLFFVGYADPDSPAGQLQAAVAAGAPEFQISPKQPLQPLRCQVDQFAFSGHSNREGIRAYVNKVQPKNVLLVHGDPSAVEWFRETLQADLPNSRVMAPPPGEPIAI